MSLQTLRNYRTLALVGLISLMPLVGCTVEQSEAGQLPDVDVNAEGGNLDVDLPEVDVDVEPGALPDLNVDWAELDIMVGETTVEVPKIDVYTEKETIAVPMIDIDWPGENDAPENQLLEVELDVTDPNARVEIVEVFAYQNNLIVVGRLHSSARSGETTTVRDRVAINAPDMDIDYYVIGDTSVVTDDNGIMIVANRSEIDVDLRRARKLFGR